MLEIFCIEGQFKPLAERVSIWVFRHSRYIQRNFAEGAPTPHENRLLHSRERTRVFFDENIHPPVIMNIITNMFILKLLALFAVNFFMQEEIFYVLTKSTICFGVEIDDMDIRTLTWDGGLFLEVTVEYDDILVSERIHYLWTKLLEILPLFMP